MTQLGRFGYIVSMAKGRNAMKIPESARKAAVVSATVAACIAKPSMIELAFTAVLKHPSILNDAFIIIAAGVATHFATKSKE